MSSEKYTAESAIRWDREVFGFNHKSLKMRHLCSSVGDINKRNYAVHRPFITSKVIILGDVAVGKTKLTEKYCIGKDIKSKSERTAHAPNAIYEKTVAKNNVSVHLKIFDTAGQERYRSITSSHYRGTNGCLLVFDVTNYDSFQSISTWHEDLHTYCDAMDISIILVGTIPKQRESSSNACPSLRVEEACDDTTKKPVERKTSMGSTSEIPDTYDGSTSKLNSCTRTRKISTEKASSFAEHLDIPYMEVEMEDISQICDVFEKLVECIIDKTKPRYIVSPINSNKTLSSDELWKQYCKKVKKCTC